MLPCSVRCERFVQKFDAGDLVSMTRGRLLAWALAGAGLTFSAHAQGSVFAVTPTWDGIATCNGRPIQSPSPRFAVVNVPQGTASLDFNMKDLDAPRFVHGGGSVAYRGAANVSPGAFNFIGPCPPGSHTYEWTVTARDSAGKSLGTATARLKYP